MQVIFIGRKPFDRCDFMPIGLDGERQTRSRRFAVEHDRACAADPVFASDMRASESKFVAQKIAEQQARFHFAGVFLSVDREGDGVCHDDQFSTFLILLRCSFRRDLQRLHRQRLRQMTLKIYRSVHIAERIDFLFTGV